MMRKLILSCVAIFGVSMLLMAQNTKIVFDANYVEVDNSFDGEYLVYTNLESKPYSVDRNGLISGKIITYHENGNVETVGGMYKGEKNGMWTAWDELGNKVNEGAFMYGAKDGLWRVWDEAGTLRYEMHYRKGKRVNTWKVYNENGTLSEEKSY